MIVYIVLERMINVSVSGDDNMVQLVLSGEVSEEFSVAVCVP